MKKKVAKELRHMAEKQTVGKPARVTRLRYRNMKKEFKIWKKKKTVSYSKRSRRQIRKSLQSEHI